MKIRSGPLIRRRAAGRRGGAGAEGEDGGKASASACPRLARRKLRANGTRRHAVVEGPEGWGVGWPDDGRAELVVER